MKRNGEMKLSKAPKYFKAQGEGTSFPLKKVAQTCSSSSQLSAPNHGHGSTSEVPTSLSRTLTPLVAFLHNPYVEGFAASAPQVENPTSIVTSYTPKLVQIASSSAHLKDHDRSPLHQLFPPQTESLVESFGESDPQLEEVEVHLPFSLLVYADEVFFTTHHIMNTIIGDVRKWVLSLIVASLGLFSSVLGFVGRGKTYSLQALFAFPSV